MRFSSPPAAFTSLHSCYVGRYVDRYVRPAALSTKVYYLMLALPRLYSIDHATRESTTASPQSLHTSAPSPHASPTLCRNSHSSPAAAMAWLANGLMASASTSRPGTPKGARTTESGTPPRRLVRACSFERKVGQQRRGSNPDNSACSMLQRRVSFGRKTREVDYTLQMEDPLQPGRLPSVRHGPCATPL